jgi:hypothetical protein
MKTYSDNVVSRADYEALELKYESLKRHLRYYTIGFATAFVAYGILIGLALTKVA